VIREGFQLSGDCRRFGAPVPALAHTKCFAGGVVGDIGAAISEARTQGLQLSGDQIIGGGLRWKDLLSIAAAALERA
jgi:hypothetical protein